MKLRNINKDDAQKIYEWRNDPVTIKYSFSTEQFNYVEHEEWFMKMLNSDDNLMFVLQDKDEDVGYIRIDLKEYVGVIGFVIDPQKRSKGNGKQIIKLVEEKIPDRVKILIGFVKTDNIASEKCFFFNNYLKIKAKDMLCFIKAL